MSNDYNLEEKAEKINSLLEELFEDIPDSCYVFHFKDFGEGSYCTLFNGTAYNLRRAYVNLGRDIHEEIFKKNVGD